MRVRPNLFDIFCNIVCFLILVGLGVYLLIVWRELPATIPTHYNAAGLADGWGGKGSLIVLYGISWLMAVGLSVVSFFPQIWNIGVEVTAQNRERVYAILYHLLTVIKLLVVLIFAFLIVMSALGKNLSVWFLPVMMIVMFGTIIGFLIALFRSR
jgi:hypothetical protein